MKRVLKHVKWLLLLSGTTITIVGITVFFIPLETSTVPADFVGIPMFTTGISEIASYFSEDRKHRSGWMFGSGTISTLFSVWALYVSRMQMLSSILLGTFAIWVLSSSII